MADARDAVVIAGGHNGLIAGAYLARAGARTLVLEARGKTGGRPSVLPGRDARAVRPARDPAHREEIEAFADRLIDRYEELAPGLKESIIARQVITLHDIERELGLPNASAFHGDLAPDSSSTCDPSPGTRTTAPPSATSTTRAPAARAVAA